MRYRTLNLQKIPRPPFPYEQFAIWKNRPLRDPQGGPLYVEIGCGVGLHPIRMAKNNLSIKVLAIERTTNKFLKFQRRLANHGHLDNIFPAHADAAVLLPHILNPKEVDGYYVLYPNPYPKVRHKNHRLAFSPLTQFICDTLKEGGTITVATNDRRYSDELRDHMPKNYPLTPIEDRIIPLDQTPRTHFEKKYLARKDVCHNLVFSRYGVGS